MGSGRDSSVTVSYTRQWVDVCELREVRHAPRGAIKNSLRHKTWEWRRQPFGLWGVELRVRQVQTASIYCWLNLLGVSLKINGEACRFLPLRGDNSCLQKRVKGDSPILYGLSSLKSSSCSKSFPLTDLCSLFSFFCDWFSCWLLIYWYPSFSGLTSEIACWATWKEEEDLRWRSAPAAQGSIWREQ